MCNFCCTFVADFNINIKPKKKNKRIDIKKITLVLALVFISFAANAAVYNYKIKILLRKIEEYLCYRTTVYLPKRRTTR